MDSADYWLELVEQRNAWIAHNFPDSAQEDTILGVIEEYGELTHSLLKRKQNIRGTDAQHVEDMKDAIGDMTVYLLGVMSYSGQVPTKITRYSIADPTEIIFIMARPIDMICHFKFAPAVLNPVEDLVGLMRTFCDHHDWDYESIVEDTWHGVSQRDWIAYPGDGKTH